jgi:hypothetical protein
MTKRDMEIYCGQLGMIVPLTYCFAVTDGLPCRNTIGCWQERVDIGRIVRESFTREELVAVFGGLPKSKMERILESMEAAPKEA